MNASKVKELLLPIPKEDFITYRFSDDVGKCCAIGHLVRVQSADPNDYEQGLGDWLNYEIEGFVRDKVRFFIEEAHSGETADLSTVNNKSSVNGYNENNPKDRVIHLLNDMIKAGY